MKLPYPPDEENTLLHGLIINYLVNTRELELCLLHREMPPSKTPTVLPPAKISKNRNVLVRN